LITLLPAVPANQGAEFLYPGVAEEREFKIPLKQIPVAQTRFFSPHQRFEAKAWLLSFTTPHSLTPILGQLLAGAFSIEFSKPGKITK
jgi:hypothetical protein